MSSACLLAGCLSLPGLSSIPFLACLLPCSPCFNSVRSGLPSPFCLISFQLLLLPPLLPLFSPGPLLLSSLLPRPPASPSPRLPHPALPLPLSHGGLSPVWPGPPSVHVPSGSDGKLGWGEAVVAEILSGGLWVRNSSVHLAARGYGRGPETGACFGQAPAGLCGLSHLSLASVVPDTMES